MSRTRSQRQSDRRTRQSNRQSSRNDRRTSRNDRRTARSQPNKGTKTTKRVATGKTPNRVPTSSTTNKYTGKSSGKAKTRPTTYNYNDASNEGESRRVGLFGRARNTAANARNLRDNGVNARTLTQNDKRRGLFGRVNRTARRLAGGAPTIGAKANKFAAKVNKFGDHIREFGKAQGERNREQYAKGYHNPTQDKRTPPSRNKPTGLFGGGGTKTRKQKPIQPVPESQPPITIEEPKEEPVQLSKPNTHYKQVFSDESLKKDIQEEDK